jgi:hypothetical protein
MNRIRRECYEIIAVELLPSYIRRKLAKRLEHILEYMKRGKDSIEGSVLSTTQGGKEKRKSWNERE